MSQFNMQPVTPKRTIKERRVTYLMLEGKGTEPLYAEIYSILKKHGLKEMK